MVGCEVRGGVNGGRVVKPEPWMVMMVLVAQCAAPSVLLVQAWPLMWEMRMAAVPKEMWRKRRISVMDTRALTRMVLMVDMADEARSTK